MPFYGSLESLLRYIPTTSFAPISKESEENDNSEISLEGLLQSKLLSFSTILSDIDGEITGRKTLSQDLRYRIYQHYLYLKQKLFEMYSWPIGGNRSIEGRRSALEKQLDALKQEKREEQHQCWQDIAQLKKEFRVWFKQYRDLASRMNLVLEGSRRRSS